jgi:CheY-like chemotaxis protein/HD-like signal output (HDOD) protein
MSTILIVDDMAVIREPIAAALRAKGYTAACASEGKEALALVKREPPDLILLDVSMPGMDGLSVLRVLRSDPASAKVPVILLTASADKEHVVQASKFGVRDYVLKSRFSFTELLARVEKYVGPGAPAIVATEVPQTKSPQSTAAPQPTAPPSGPLSRLTRQQTLERVAACTQTKTLPGVVAEVMSLVNSPRADMADLASVLKRDPVLASRVLLMANSAAFTSQKPRITTIDEAVRNIGVAGVRTMVISVGIFESFPPQGTDGSHITRCWQHSFAMASVMDKLVPAGGAIAPGVAHLAGLCHDLCDIVLRQYFATEYKGIADLVARTGRPRWQVESLVFGMPYHELVSLVLGKLGLPPPIITPIGDAFAVGVKKDDRGAGGALTRALRIANLYAHGLMLAAGPDAPVAPVTVAEHRAAFGDAPTPELDPGLLRSEVLTTVNLLAGVGSADAAELCRPPVKSSSRRIFYWRHAGYSELDPLAVLLGFAGEVEIRGESPSPQDLPGYDALVIAAPRQESAAQQLIGTLPNLLRPAQTPVLCLSGLPAEQLGGPQSTVHRQLPVSLADATLFLNSVKPRVSAAA